MRNLPFSRFERALLGALLALTAVNFGLRFALSPKEPFSVISAYAEATVDPPPDRGSPSTEAEASTEPDSPVDSPSGGGSAASPGAFDLLAFLNEAPEERLAELPGIGPVLAGRIVAYREQVGPFRRLEEITAVKGIGPARFEALLAFAQGRSPQ